MHAAMFAHARTKPKDTTGGSLSRLVLQFYSLRDLLSTSNELPHRLQSRGTLIVQPRFQKNLFQRIGFPQFGHRSITNGTVATIQNATAGYIERSSAHEKKIRSTKPKIVIATSSCARFRSVIFLKYLPQPDALLCRLRDRIAAEFS
jgi:hypothetical protein